MKSRTPSFLESKTIGKNLELIGKLVQCLDLNLQLTRKNEPCHEMFTFIFVEDIQTLPLFFHSVKGFEFLHNREIASLEDVIYMLLNEIYSFVWIDKRGQVHNIENIFFGCRSLEEALIKVDLLNIKMEIA